MVALNKFGTTAAYIVGDASTLADTPDDELFTCFVPALSVSRLPKAFTSINAAIGANGTFFQFRKAYLAANQSKLNDIIDGARRWADGKKLAFAQMEEAQTTIFTIKHDGAWRQVGQAASRFPHLGNLVLLPNRGKLIGGVEIKGDPTALLQFGTFDARQSIRGGTRRMGRVDPVLDLASGLFRFDLGLKAEHLGGFNTGQPYAFASGRLDSEIESSVKYIEVFNGAAMGADRLPVSFQIDFFPFGSVADRGRQKILSLYRERARVVISPDHTLSTTKTKTLLLNQRDTLGRPLEVIAPADGDAGFHFMPVPRELFHDGADPRQVSVKRWSASLVPTGAFELIPVSTSDTVERRLKLGPSNLEVLDIVERPGQLAVRYTFGVKGPAEMQATGGEVAGTCGYLRKTLLRFAEAAGTPQAIIDDLIDGPDLSNQLLTIWPGFEGIPEPTMPTTLAADGFSTPRRRLSAQSDGLVGYRKTDTSVEHLDYQLDVPTNFGPQMVERMPFTFLDGIPPNPIGRVGDEDSGAGDIETPFAKDRHRRRLAFADTLGGFDVPANQLALDEQDPSITPQGFEMRIEAGLRKFVFAKTLFTQNDGTTVDLEFTATVKNSFLWGLFQQSDFLLVLPSENAIDPRQGDTPVSSVEISAGINIGDWRFDVLFSETETPNPADPKTQEDPPVKNLRSIFVFKYRKGKLRDLLVDPAFWENKRTLPDPWIRGAVDACRHWIRKIDDAVDAENSLNAADPRPKDTARAFRPIKSVIESDDWTGMLVINPTIDIGDMPTELQGLSAGIDLERFRAHHIGFTQNRIDTPGSQSPRIVESSLMGLIDYKDTTGFESQDNEFDFRVNRLQVLFANSDVVDFYCLLKVRVPSWLGDKIAKVDKGALDRQGEDEQNVFGIIGRYISFVGADGKKVNRYSFVYEQGIDLTPDNSQIFKAIQIDRVELRTTKSEVVKGEGNTQLLLAPPEASDSIRIAQEKVETRSITTELLVDATIAFESDLGDGFLKDIFGFDKLGFNGVTIPFLSQIRRINGGVWKNLSIAYPMTLTFDGLSLEVDPSRRRENSLLSGFPIKFQAFRFFNAAKALADLDFMTLMPRGGGSAAFEYALEWRVDFGELAALLGFDADLKGSLLVGWRPGGQGFCVGLRFDDMGGSVLDIGIGSVIRIKADYFDIFDVEGDNGRQSNYLVASNLRLKIFNQDLPPGTQTKMGLLLAPNPDEPLSGPLGWMTTLSQDQLGFIENFFIAIGQRMRYTGSSSDTAAKIVETVRSIAEFKFENISNPPDDTQSKREILNQSKEFRKKFKNHLEYNKENEWFLALGGEVKEFIKGNAVYNPPNLFAGQVGFPGILEISIVYQQVTPQVGIYTGTLTIDEALRSIEMGGVRIQLPRIMLKLDTDGGYAIIVGLNPDRPDDFSNAAGAEVGILKGDGGFMFANIHGAAFNDVPRLAHDGYADDKGKLPYSPVMRVTLAARVGLGRTLEILIFKGHASITVYGILSGTVGELNPKELSQRLKKELRDNAPLPKRYHKYWGEIGVMAEVYGVIDFGITRQRLTARLLVGLGLMFEMWRETVAYVRGELSLALDWVIGSIKIFGKRYEIKIRLEFKTDFRHDETLDPGRGSDFETWFGPRDQTLTLQGVYSSRSKTVPVFASDWAKTPRATPVSQRRPLPVYVTPDLTLDDTGKPVLVPLALIPSVFDPDTGTTDPGAFTDLIDLIFDWTLCVMIGSRDVPQPGESIHFDHIHTFTREIDERDWNAARQGANGEWSAGVAWTVLKERFTIDFQNKADSNGEPGPDFTGAGTAIHLYTGWSYARTLSDGTVEPEQAIGGQRVSPNILSDLDEFFDAMVVDFSDDRGEQRTVRARVTTKTQQPLDDFLFAEYIEAIARIIWSEIKAAVERDVWKDIVNPDDPKITIARVRDRLHDRAGAIAGHMNRQMFNGSRIMKGGAPDASETESLYAFANYALTIDTWGGDGVTSVTLRHAEVKDGQTPQTVLFDGFDANAVATFASSGPVIDPNTIVYSVDHSETVRGNRHALVDQVALVDSTGDARIGTVWTIPESLASKAYNGDWPDPVNGVTSGAPEVVLEPFEVGEAASPRDIDEASDVTSLAYVPAVSVSVPVTPIKNRPGAFEVKPFNESDRRAMDMLRRLMAGGRATAFDVSMMQLSFMVAEIDEGSPRISRFVQVGFTQAGSFLARVNLSLDPNPTQQEQRFQALSSDPYPVFARPSAVPSSAFLNLLWLAADTNSGGYILKLDGFDSVQDPAKVESIRLVLSLPKVEAKATLPAIANILFTDGDTVVRSSDSRVADLAMREVASQTVPIGEPGVYAIKITRPNPNTLYTDPRPGRSGNVTRAQALRFLETIDGQNQGTYAALDAKSQLPEDILLRAGGGSVDLAKRFNLAQVKVVDTPHFKMRDEKLDLPSAPESGGGDRETAPFVYTYSIPAYRFVKEGKVDNDRGFGGDPKRFVYGAIGKTIVLDLTFRDTLGFSPATASKRLSVTGSYTDPLISPHELLGCKLDHAIDRADGELSLTWSFNPSALTDKRKPNGQPALRAASKTASEIEAFEEEQNKNRLRTARAEYVRAAMQVRDKNTSFRVMSALGLKGADANGELALKDDPHLSGLHTFLMACIDSLDAFIKTDTPKHVSDHTLRFEQVGVIPDGGFARYVVRWTAERTGGLGDNAALTTGRNEKVARVVTDIPLAGDTGTTGVTLIKAADEAIRSAFKVPSSDKPRLRLARTREGRNRDVLYIVDHRLVDLSTAEDTREPIPAAFPPLALTPFNRKDVWLWDWGKHLKPPTEPMGQGAWEKRTVSGFDQDIALEQFLLDVDDALRLEAGVDMWSGTPDDKKRLEAVLDAKRAFGNVAPERLTSIFAVESDASTIESARDAVHRNVSNSLGKRLARYNGIDTFMVSTLTYNKIGQDGRILLYGRITGQSESAKTAIKFLPAALHRNGKQGDLVVQVDAAQAERTELVTTPMAFEIDHIRWDSDGDETPFSVRWLKLVTPYAVSLGPTEKKNNKTIDLPVDIPVLFKRIPRKPDVTIAPPKLGDIGDTDPFGVAIKKAREWGFRFVYDRSQAAVQDDLVIDVDYNLRPQDYRQSGLHSNARNIAEVLFEYQTCRPVLLKPENRSVWYEALAAWGQQIAEALSVMATASIQPQDAKPYFQQFFEVSETTSNDNNELVVKLLKRRSDEWDLGDFKYSISFVKAVPPESQPAFLSARQAQVLDGFSVKWEEVIGDKSGYHASRLITIDEMDVMRVENAWPSVAVFRNRSLKGRGNVRDAFIYSTEAVRPGDPYTPFLDVESEIVLPGGSDLTAGLTTLFRTLLQLDPAPTEETPKRAARKPLLDLIWGYESGHLDSYKGGKNDQGMRVYRFDPIGMLTARRPDDTFSEGIEAAVKSIGAWEGTNGGRPNGGRYVFEVRVYSQLLDIEKPLLRLRNVLFRL